MTLTTIRKRADDKRQQADLPWKDGRDHHQQQSSVTEQSPWHPSVRRAYQLLMFARISSAVWSNISDCDETYNYLEPLHYLLHGHGLQTWEYSPVYAIRSYAYIWLYAVPVKFFQLFNTGDKILQFLFLRITLALVCSGCEAYFYKAVVKKFGPGIGRLWLLFSLFSPGMFISTSAFLPSTFAMYSNVLALASWWLANGSPSPLPLLPPLLKSVFFVALGSLVGWPFAVALGIPLAYDMIFNRRMWFQFGVYSLASLVVCLVPMVLIDSYYYGRLVVAPLNIVLYNVFSEHGPDLYGVEPWSYYILNGFLNFNVVFLLAIVSLFFLIPRIFFSTPDQKESGHLLKISGLYIWLAIFLLQPHKEERFLFPVYPLICLSGAISLDMILKCVLHLANSAQKLKCYQSLFYKLVLMTISIVFILLSFSRLYIIHQGYHAPLDVYEGLNKIIHNSPQYKNLKHHQSVNVCVGKEWYRFPSHFFLPDGCRLVFLKSDFAGQLPGEYPKVPGATRVVPPHVNDLNKEETTRYVNLTSCDFLVDLDTGRSSRYEPNYSQQSGSWKVVFSRKFLDAQESDRLFRAFYIPMLKPQQVKYGNYNILVPVSSQNQ